LERKVRKISVIENDYRFIIDLKASLIKSDQDLPTISNAVSTLITYWKEGHKTGEQNGK
jgi:hypothetical protein